jgi:hypothetical protein
MSIIVLTNISLYLQTTGVNTAMSFEHLVLLSEHVVHEDGRSKGRQEQDAAETHDPPVRSWQLSQQ